MFSNTFANMNSNEDICEEMRKYANRLARTNQIQKALDVLRNVYDKRIEQFGEMNAETLQIKYDVGEIYEAKHEYDEALLIFKDVFEKSNHCLGENHSLSMQARFRVAVNYFNLGEYDKSYEISKALYRQQMDVLGKQHKSTLLCKRNIADILVIQTKHQEALKIYQEIMEESKGVYAPSDYEIISIGDIMETLQPFELSEKPKSETIHSLSMTGNLEKVTTLIETGVEVNGKDSDGRSPLHCAAQFGHVEIAKLLLEKGAKYNTVNNAGNTPIQVTEAEALSVRKLLLAVEDLFEGAKGGNREKVLHILETQESWIVNIVDKDGCTALHWAALCGHHAVVKLLLEFGADATLVSDKSNSALHIAASKGHSEIVKLLLQSVRRDKLHDFINGKTKTGGNTPLHIAAERGFLDVLKALMSNGAVYSMQNKSGKTPLDVAKEFDCLNLLKLIEGLFQDAEKGNPGIINKLRDIDSSEIIAVTRVRDNDKRTLLQVLTVGNHTDLARELLWVLNYNDKK